MDERQATEPLAAGGAGDHGAAHDPRRRDLRAFKNRNLAIIWFQTALMGFVPHVFAVLVPQHAQQQAGCDAALAGLFLAPSC